jgi:hypothetical protein
MGDSDRRWQARHFLRLEGRLIYSTYDDPIVTVDISAEGVGLQSRQSLEPGIRIAIEVGQTDRERFIFLGKVAWCVQGGDAGMYLYRMGLAADAISSREQTAVEPDEKLEMLNRIMELYAPKSSSSPG